MMEISKMLVGLSECQPVRLGVYVGRSGSSLLPGLSM